MTDSSTQKKIPAIGSVWVGTVIDNLDPKFEGRIKVRVAGKYDDITDENLPWCYHMSAVNGGSGGGWGEISIPKKDTIIQVVFLNGDILSPHWISFPKINSALSAELSEDYEDARVITYDEDAQLKIFYLPNTGVLIHLDGSEIVINPDNSIKIEHKDTESIIELIGDKINVISQTDINVVSPTVNVTGETTNLGTAPQYSDTLAEPLFQGLMKLAALIDAKLPASGSVAQAIIQETLELATSKTVKTTLDN